MMENVVQLAVNPFHYNLANNASMRSIWLFLKLKMSILHFNFNLFI